MRPALRVLAQGALEIPVMLRAMRVAGNIAVEAAFEHAFAVGQ